MNYIEIPPSYRTSLVARIKIMCDLDIAERRKPFFGRQDRLKKFGPPDIRLRFQMPAPVAGWKMSSNSGRPEEPLPLEKSRLSPRNPAT